MRKVKTNVIFAITAFTFVLVGITRIGVVALRPVKEADGNLIFRSDGRILTESDPWGDIRVNWLSNLFLLLFISLFLWWLARVYRIFRAKRREQ